MEEIKLYQDIENKLDTLLAENGLVGTFRTDKYPIVLCVGMDQSLDAQMELYETTDHDASAQDAKLKFIFRDGEILVRTDSRLVISEALMNKIKGHAKKKHYLYLQAFFHRVVGSKHPDPEPDDMEEDEDEE